MLAITYQDSQNRIAAITVRAGEEFRQGYEEVLGLGWIRSEPSRQLARLEEGRG